MLRDVRSASWSDPTPLDQDCGGGGNSESTRGIAANAPANDIALICVSAITSGDHEPVFFGFDAASMSIRWQKNDTEIRDGSSTQSAVLPGDPNQVLYQCDSAVHVDNRDSFLAAIATGLSNDAFLVEIAAADGAIQQVRRVRERFVSGAGSNVAAVPGEPIFRANSIVLTVNAIRHRATPAFGRQPCGRLVGPGTRLRRQRLDSGGHRGRIASPGPLADLVGSPSGDVGRGFGVRD